jgi:hypothetical protein
MYAKVIPVSKVSGKIVKTTSVSASIKTAAVFISGRRPPTIPPQNKAMLTSSPRGITLDIQMLVTGFGHEQ